jgi:hydroxymethylpyrimidine/phosphomethylpyrimidine kinase
VSFPRVLVIAGIDPVGRAGISRDLAVLDQERAEGAVVVSALTVQNSRGVRWIQPVDPPFVSESIQTVLAGGDIDAVKVGLIADNATCRHISAALDGVEVPIVIDPVMRASSGGLLTSEDTVSGLKGLLLRATVLTPNIPEAEALTGEKGTSAKERLHMASSLVRAGAKAVLLKGGHVEDGKGADILLEASGKRTTYPIDRLDLGSLNVGRGKGCELSTRIAALLAKGLELPEAVRVARLRLVERLEREILIDRFPRKEAMRDYVVAFDNLLSGLKRECIPQAGANLSYATPDAMTLKDVVGLAGKVTAAGDSIAVAGLPRPGGPRHTAKMALAATHLMNRPVWVLSHKLDPALLEKLGPEHIAILRKEEPDTSHSTMIWMIEHAVKKRGGMPSYISDDGAIGKEPTIRILASSPEELLKLHRQLHGEKI